MHFLKVLASFVGKTLSFILVLKSETQIFFTLLSRLAQICFAWYLKCEIHNDLIVYFTNTFTIKQTRYLIS